jgi:hypothetical protein
VLDQPLAQLLPGTGAGREPIFELLNGNAAI